jgi:hypothetical protein
VLEQIHVQADAARFSAVPELPEDELIDDSIGVGLWLAEHRTLGVNGEDEEQPGIVVR